MAENVRFGYCRVSSASQNLDRQIEALREQGIEDRHIFCDKVSGVREHKPGFEEMMTHLREGDTVLVLSFDRLARSVKQLLEIVETFDNMGVNLVSIHEEIDTTTAHGKFFFTVSAAFAAFERDMIKERQRKGIAVAKKQGRIQGRPRVDAESLEQAVTLYRSGKYSVSKIAGMTGISRNSLYRALGERGITGEREQR